jgi:hypothetical protein
MLHLWVEVRNEHKFPVEIPGGKKKIGCLDLGNKVHIIKKDSKKYYVRVPSEFNWLKVEFSDGMCWAR